MPAILPPRRWRQEDHPATLSQQTNKKKYVSSLVVYFCYCPSLLLEYKFQTLTVGPCLKQREVYSLHGGREDSLEERIEVQCWERPRLWRVSLHEFSAPFWQKNPMIRGQMDGSVDTGARGHHDSLNSIPRTHMVEGGTGSHSCSLPFTQAPHSVPSNK